MMIDKHWNLIGFSEMETLEGSLVQFSLFFNIFHPFQGLQSRPISGGALHPYITMHGDQVITLDHAKPFLYPPTQELYFTV